mgnify:FL=1
MRLENQYEPPFHQTNTMTNLVIEIADYAGQIGSHENLSKHPELRRENRIRTIYSSLAIEQNTLSLEHVTDVINGRHIIGPPEDIREVCFVFHSNIKKPRHLHLRILQWS